MVSNDFSFFSARVSSNVRWAERREKVNANAQWNLKVIMILLIWKSLESDASFSVAQAYKKSESSRFRHQWSAKQGQTWAFDSSLVQVHGNFISVSSIGASKKPRFQNDAPVRGPRSIRYGFESLRPSQQACGGAELGLGGQLVVSVSHIFYW